MSVVTPPDLIGEWEEIMRGPLSYFDSEVRIDLERPKRWKFNENGTTVFCGLPCKWRLSGGGRLEFFAFPEDASTEADVISYGIELTERGMLIDTRLDGGEVLILLRSCPPTKKD